jgi:Mg-chelatase subunit ChlD
LFFEILDSGKETDRVGFSRYSTSATLEARLTDNYDDINDEVQDSNADGWTNIGAGMEQARRELERAPRPMAVKMMVLMTDGLVNRPTDRSPRGYVLDEAAAAAAADIQMITISFGDDADQGLMEEVAEICHGESFHVPDNVGAGELGLRDIFEKIAHQRPVVLVD